jgi:hypothetical protein
MRLLRLADVEVRPDDRVFAHSRVLAVSVAVAAIVLSVALIFRVFNAQRTFGYYLAVLAFLFLALMHRFITARFRASNWLVRMNELGLFIQFRSYLNFHLPAEDLTVVFLPYPEIRSARLIREHTKVLDSGGQTATQTLRYIEFELGGDTAALAKALDAESAERAPKEKRWYGSTSTLYEDYPVRMATLPFLRARWAVVPRAQNFLEALRPYTTIADPIVMSQDFSQLQSLSHEEQQKSLRELTQRGETIQAIYTARRLYGCGLNEAKQMVEGLRGQSAEERSSPPRSN